MDESTQQSTDNPHTAPFDVFKELAQRVLTAPKKEVDKREAAYQRARAKKSKRGPKPQK